MGPGLAKVSASERTVIVIGLRLHTGATWARGQPTNAALPRLPVS